MAEFSRFFGSSGPDIRQYNQLEFAEVMERFVTTGVFPDYGNLLVVSESTPALMSVQLDTGKAFINGYYYSNTSAFDLTISASDPTNPRIDLIILRLDVLADRLITAEVLTGVPSPVPVAPTLTQNASIYEIELARVLVPANSTSIVNSNITNTNTLKALARNPYSLGQPAFDYSTGDLNDINVSGLFYGTFLGNAPSGFSIGFVIHIQSPNTVSAKQVFYDIASETQYTRRKTSGGVWQPWVEVFTIQTPVFTNFTLLNGATVNNSRTPKYIKQGNTVYVQGEIGTIANGTVIANLPAGYRPIYPLTFRTALATANADAHATISVATGGQITISATTGTNPITLNGITFVAEQ